MAVTPYSEDPEQARPYFKKMKLLFDKVINKSIIMQRLNIFQWV
jgi:uncharacterized pyridoxal phosphate-containing UPF0001 family protein